MELFGTQTTVATGNGPAGIAAADFNNDGHPDLAVTNHSDSTVSILLGNRATAQELFSRKRRSQPPGPARSES